MGVLIPSYRAHGRRASSLRQPPAPAARAGAGKGQDGEEATPTCASAT